MKRALGVLGGVVMVGFVLGLSGAGCTLKAEDPDAGTNPSSSTSTTAPTPTSTDAGPDRATPKIACYDEDAALAIKGTAPAAGTNKCTSMQIGELKTKCLGSGATGCDAYVEANKDCARCVLGALKGDTPDATPLPALIPVSDASVSPNVAACAALVIGRPDCAVKLAGQVVCTSSACATCESEAEDTECLAKATDGICKTTVDKACNDAVNAAAAQWQSVCRGTAFDDTYVKVANVLCGAGVADGGAQDSGGGG
jgi:hypothetical protein